MKTLKLESATPKKEMTAQERRAKLEAWHASLDEDTRLFVALVTKAYDKMLESIEKGEDDEETREMLRLHAAEYYGMKEDSGFVVLFSAFADGFIAGLEVPIDLGEGGPGECPR